MLLTVFNCPKKPLHIVSVFCFMGETQKMMKGYSLILYDSDIQCSRMKEVFGDLQARLEV